MVHRPFVPSGYWSPCEPLVWNQGFPTSLGGLSTSTNRVKASYIHFSSSQFRKQHLRYEKAVSRTSLAEAIYAWPCESIWKGRGDSSHLGRNREFVRIIMAHNSPNVCLSLSVRG
ncbi:unnamed protein product [Schistosoma mattheei]|uniref:Uncharacterized protein n=1 Tax=Schistosoma mattheei TaxID=31246 RepID=A0A3P8GKA1_9TREM|nr:unnamed protein product [Schistosoma mattheei]